MEKQKTSAEKGTDAENVAADYYLKQGYSLLVRNFRTPLGELDLVLGRNQEILIVEVKGRREFHADHAWSPRWRDKKRRLRRMALIFLDRHERRFGGQEELRLDIVYVTQGRVSHRFEDEPFV